MATQIDHLMGNPPAEQMSMTPYGTPAQGCTRQQIWADVNSNHVDVLGDWNMDEDNTADESHNLNASQANQPKPGLDASTSSIE